MLLSLLSTSSMWNISELFWGPSGMCLFTSGYLKITNTYFKTAINCFQCYIVCSVSHSLLCVTQTPLTCQQISSRTAIVHGFLFLTSLVLERTQAWLWCTEAISLTDWNAKIITWLRFYFYSIENRDYVFLKSIQTCQTMFLLTMLSKDDGGLMPFDISNLSLHFPFKTAYTECNICFVMRPFFSNCE